MELLKTIIEAASNLLWNTPEVFPVMVLLLLATGVFLTLQLRLIQFRRLWHSVLVIAGKYDNPEDAGDVSHFQALSAALSATVGIGNIAGVATAIHYGGPGAVFWLWVTGFIGMATKFTECTLALKYRKIHPDGSASGGPMYYMREGLGGNWGWVGMVFAVCAVISSFGSGNAVQAFTMADSFRTDFGIPPWISGLVSASLVAFVILGGIKRIGAVASKLVPFMGLMYVLCALAVIVLNIEHLPLAISTIVREAFTPSAGIAGFAGSTFIFTLTWGVKRGLFSNEAGQGSAPIAHAAAKTDEPVREGAVALLGPLIDTVVICAMTGLVIVITGTWNQRFDDQVDLSSRSSLTVVVEDTKVGVRGVVKDEDKLSGEFAVEEGAAVGFRLVRNHATVEELSIQLDERPFAGRLVVKEGAIEKVVGADGAEVSVESVFAAGKMLYNGSPVTAMGFRVGLQDVLPNGNLLVTFAVFLFALSTAISWSYYGDRSAEYVFGPKAIVPYRVIFVIMHFLGAIFSLELVWGFADVALGIMAIPNLFAILLLSRYVRREADDYYRRMGYRKGL